VCEKDSGVWAEARKLTRTAVFSSPSRERDLLIWVDVDKSSSHQLSQNEIASDNPCSQQLSGETLSVSEKRVNQGLIQSARSIRLGEIPLLPFRFVRGNHGSSAARVAVR